MGERSWLTRAVLTGLAMALVPAVARAQALPLPSVEVGLKPAGTPQEGIQSIQLLLLLTALSVAPAFLILTTAFTRIAVVLSFVRSALGSQQLPPNQVILGLSLILTMAVMSPTFQAMNEAGVQPYLRGEIDHEQALAAAGKPLKEFMLRHTRQQDLALMLEITRSAPPAGSDDIPFLAAVPAFAISELKTAFTMGFVIFLPFVVIDLVTASTLMSMGMMMVPPALVALPFKILLFILVDGWHLVVRSLFMSFQS